MTNALILIDIQNDYFPTGRWPVDGMEAAATNAARLLARARTTGQMVVHIRHEIPGDSPPFFASGSSGAEIHPLVAPQANELSILKHTPNSFHQTDLHEQLQKQGVNSLTLCGAMSQMCIDATTRAAADLGYANTLAHDACAARALDFNGTTVPAAQVHAAFMAALSGRYARLVTTDEAL